MKKLILALAVFGLTAVSISTSQSRISWEREQVQDLTDKTVLIVAEYEDVSALGTGVLISKKGLILTAAHVVDGDPVDIYAVTNKDRTYKCTLVGLNNRSDLALVRVHRSAQQFPFADLYLKRDLWVGQPLLIIGHPNELFWTVSMGNITRLSFSIVRFCGMGETDAFVNPGNSGGPVFNRTGEVIGIVSAMYVDVFRTPTGIGIFTHISEIHKFMKKMKPQLQEYRYPKPRLRLGDI